MMSEMLSTIDRPKERPFPWHCPKCRKKDVWRDTIRYECQRMSGGQLVDVVIPDLAVPRCHSCGELVFDYEAEQQINARTAAVGNRGGGLIPHASIRIESFSPRPLIVIPGSDATAVIRIARENYDGLLKVSVDGLPEWLTSRVLHIHEIGLSSQIDLSVVASQGAPTGRTVARLIVRGNGVQDEASLSVTVRTPPRPSGKSLWSLLTQRGLSSTDRVKVMRHADPRYDIDELAREGWLEVYQSYQAKRIFECDYVVFFIGTKNFRARFFGVYRVILPPVAANTRPLPPNCPYDFSDRGPNDWFYELEAVPGFEDLRSVVIDWGLGVKARNQWLNKPDDKKKPLRDKTVVAGLPTGKSIGGSVFRYDRPTEPVAEADWDALQ